VSLSAGERAVLDALLPPGGDLPGLFETGFDEFEAHFSRTAPLPMRLGWRAALFAARWASPALIGRLPPLDRLDPAAREAALEAMGKSRVYLLRQLFLLLKAVSSFGYGLDARVRARIGYS
jgi:hypothetical protein